MERPREVSTLAKALALLSVAALFGVAVVAHAHLPIAPQFLPLGDVTTRWVLVVTIALYGSSTFITAYALWRMRPFAKWAYYAFVVSLALYCAVFIFLIRVPKQWGVGVAFAAFLVAGLYWGWRIVQRASQTTANAL
jgi:hypothetical protein